LIGERVRVARAVWRKIDGLLVFFFHFGSHDASSAVEISSGRVGVAIEVPTRDAGSTRHRIRIDFPSFGPIPVPASGVHIMRFLSFLFLAAFVVIVGLFAYENNRSVTVDLFRYTWDIPLALLAIGVYLLGMFSGWFVVGMLK